jgi:nucleoside-diphosphate-sugar epimerase
MFGNCQLYIHSLQEITSLPLNWEELSEKSVLVTGSTGLIGTVLTDVLMLLNHILGLNMKVYAGYRNAQYLHERFGQYSKDELFFPIHIELERSIKSKITFNYIIHAASNADPKSFFVDPVGTMATNFLGVYHLLKYATGHGLIRFLLVSTGEVYGRQPSIIPEGIREDYSGPLDTMLARSCYPSAKRASETLCVAYAKQYGIETVVARLCHVLGPTQTSNDSRASAQFLRDALARRDIVLKSKGIQVRSYCYVVDTVAALFTILLGGESGNAYNIANPDIASSIRQLAETIADCAGVGIQLDFSNDAEDASNAVLTNGVLNADKLTHLGWQPRFNLLQAVTHTLAVMRTLE